VKKKKIRHCKFNNEDFSRFDLLHSVFLLIILNGGVVAVLKIFRELDWPLVQQKINK